MSQITTLESIFGTPIQAIIDADFMAAKKTIKYIQEYGFEPNSENGAAGNRLGKLKETSFWYNTVDESGAPGRRLVKIPTLSLLPLPLLHVDSADFDFSVRIVDSTDQAEGNTLNATLVPQSGGGKGNTSAPHLDANINVKMKVVQSDIPAGLSNLLALMGSNTQNIAPNKISLKDSLVRLKKDKYVETELALYTPKGVPVKDALVHIAFDESCGVLLACNRKRWSSGCSMLTNEEGKIRYIVAYGPEKSAKPGTVYSLTFTCDGGAVSTQELYVE